MLHIETEIKRDHLETRGREQQSVEMEDSVNPSLQYSAQAHTNLKGSLLRLLPQLRGHHPDQETFQKPSLSSAQFLFQFSSVLLPKKQSQICNQCQSFLKLSCQQKMDVEFIHMSSRLYYCLPLHFCPCSRHAIKYYNSNLYITSDQ